MGEQLYGKLATKYLELEPGQTHRLEIDLSHLAPARLQGRILVDGRAPLDAMLILTNRSRRYGARVTLAVDGQGKFLSPAILPGSYELSLYANKSSGNVAIYPSSEPFQLTPGASLERDFAFHHRRLRVRVVGKDGKTAVANTRFMLHGEPRLTKRITTDAEGRFVLEPAPERSITLELYGTGSWFQLHQPQIFKTTNHDWINDNGLASGNCSNWKPIRFSRDL